MVTPDDAPHLLVVDDDDRLRALLLRFLRKEGFAVSAVTDAAEAARLLKLFIFDLIILDVMMPGESGLSLAGRLRQSGGGTPILMLSARAEALDRVSGLESGADDYLSKPFEPKELLLRVRAVLRRTRQAEAPPPAIAFGEYIFAPQMRELRRGAEPVRLTSAEAALLGVLAEHLNQPVAREKLAELTGQAGTERSIDVQITRLRRKIEQESNKPLHVRTVRGAGYVLHGKRL